MSPWSKSIATRAISVKATWSSSLRRRPIACCRHARLRAYAAVAVGNIYLTSVSLLRSAMPLCRSCVASAASMRSAPSASLAHACRRSDQMEYRNKLEFSCAFDAKRGFQMGFHQKGSDKILAADACPLAHKQAQKTPKALRGALRYLTGREDLGIHRVGVRHSHRSGDLEVALWTTPGPFPRNAVAKTLSTAVKASSIVRVMTADAGSARQAQGPRDSRWPRFLARNRRRH